MDSIHVHAENRIYKVYGPGPATLAAQTYAHVRGIFTVWLLSIIPFVIVYINTFNVQYGLTVSFFIVLIELGKHLTFYDEPTRAFLVLEYYPPSDDGYPPNLRRNESENSVSESNEPSESAEDEGDEGEEETIETSCETEGAICEHPCETEGDIVPTEGECEGEEDAEEDEQSSEEEDVTPTEGEGDVAPTEGDVAPTEGDVTPTEGEEETPEALLESPQETNESTEKNEIQTEAQCDPKED